MRIDTFPASICSNSLEFFNYVMKDFIIDLFNRNQSRVESYEEFEVLKLSEHEHIVKITKESNTRISKIECPSTYLSALHKAQGNGGIYLKLHGHYAFAYAESLSEYFDVTKEEVLKIYKEFVSQDDDEEMQEYASNLSTYIPKLHDFVIKKKRIKKSIDSDKIKDIKKGYCDLDFYTYMYDNKLIVVCYASATMYAVEFNESGFVVYGERNDYGKEIEQKLDENYDWDNEEYEPSFLKHLTPSLEIMRVENDQVIILNEMVQHLHLIVEYIGVEEKLWKKVEDDDGYSYSSGNDEIIITFRDE